MEAAGKWEGWDVRWWGALLWELRKKEKKENKREMTNMES